MTTTQWLLIGGPYDGRVVDVQPGVEEIVLADPAGSMNDAMPPTGRAPATGVHVRHLYRAHRFWWRGQKYCVGAHGGTPLSLVQQQSLSTLVRRLGVRPMG